MRSGRYSGRELVGRGMSTETGADLLTRIAVADRMGRLQTEAEHERLVRSLRVPSRRISARSRLGHALMALGRFVEGAGAHQTECPSPLHA